MHYIYIRKSFGDCARRCMDLVRAQVKRMEYLSRAGDLQRKNSVAVGKYVYIYRERNMHL